VLQTFDLKLSGRIKGLRDKKQKDKFAASYSSDAKAMSVVDKVNYAVIQSV
jgi:hypothetical protein